MGVGETKLIFINCWLPSLLEARAGNMAVAAPHGELFEVARAYIGRKPASASGGDASPVEEPLLVAAVTAAGFAAAKGLAEALLARLGIGAEQAVTFRPIELDLFSRGRAAEIVLHGATAAERIGVVGEFSRRALDRAGLEATAAGVELRLDRLDFAIGRDRPLRRPSDYPAIERDLNLVVDEAVAWGDIEAAIRSGAGQLLERCRLVEIWKDAERLGPGRKSVVVSLRLRSDSGTLSSDDAKRAVDAVISSCNSHCGAVLR